MNMRPFPYGPGIEITGRSHAGIRRDPDARGGCASRPSSSERSAAAARTSSPAARSARPEFDRGTLPDFLPETRAIRDGDWTCAPIPADIVDRRVEITGPVDRKMVINALNSGANVFMADFEDANTPRWDNNLQGQINLRDAIRRRIDYTSPEGKAYRLKPQDRRALRPAARLAPAREARADRRRAHFRRHLRFRAVLLPQRERAPCARQRPVFLPAEAREPSRGAPLERRLRARAGRARRARADRSARRC